MQLSPNSRNNFPSFLMGDVVFLWLRTNLKYWIKECTTYIILIGISNESMPFIVDFKFPLNFTLNFILHHSDKKLTSLDIVFALMMVHLAIGKFKTIWWLTIETLLKLQFFRHDLWFIFVCVSCKLSAEFTIQEISLN